MNKENETTKTKPTKAVANLVDALVRRGLAQKKELMIVVSVLVFVILIAYGFNTKTHITSYCSSNNTIYMQANFSKTTTGSDFYGNYYSETDYWSERVSEKYYVKMHNFEISDANIKYVKNGDVAYPSSSFPYDKSYRSHPGFDNFNFKTSSTILQHFKNGEYVSINNGSYMQCYLFIDEPTKVNYWYSMAYGV